MFWRRLNSEINLFLWLIYLDIYKYHLEYIHCLLKVKMEPIFAILRAIVICLIIVFHLMLMRWIFVGYHWQSNSVYLMIVTKLIIFYFWNKAITRIYHFLFGNSLSCKCCYYTRCMRKTAVHWFPQPDNSQFGVRSFVTLKLSLKHSILDIFWLIIIIIIITLCVFIYHDMCKLNLADLYVKTFYINFPMIVT